MMLFKQLQDFDERLRSSGGIFFLIGWGIGGAVHYGTWCTNKINNIQFETEQLQKQFSRTAHLEPINRVSRILFKERCI